jgi:hypothetical protein
MGARPVDDKASDTLVVDSGEGFWTGSSTLPHLHQPSSDPPSKDGGFRRLAAVAERRGVGRYSESAEPPVPTSTTPVIRA